MKAGRKFTVYAVDQLDEWARAQFSKPVRSTSEHNALAA
jgi:hypothetical protein